MNHQLPDLPAILTIEELCEHLRCHRATVYRMIKQRRIPYFKIGADYRFVREHILEWEQAASK